MSGDVLKHLVLALYPTSRGFAFILLEGPESPVDWGLKEFKGPKKNSRALKAAEKLLKRFRPDDLVIENTAGPDSKRSSRIQHFYSSLVKMAAAKGVDVYRYAPEQVWKAFAPTGARTRHDIAGVIAKHVPAFSSWLPRRRKAWTSEDQRQSLFDAMAIALVHYNSRKLGSS